MRSFMLGQPVAKMLCASVTTESLRQPRHELPRFVDERMGRIDDEKPCMRQRLLAMRADRSGADVKFESQSIWRAERANRIEKTGAGSSVANWTPHDVSPGRPFAQRQLKRTHDAAGFAGGLERRVDQDDAAPLLGRQVGVKRDIAVRSDDAQSPVAR